MIRNYIKLGLRNLAKNRLSSTINILGLALAVGCCLVVFRYFDWSMNMDSFHRKIGKLFVVERVAEKNGSQQLWGNSPSALGPLLKNDLSQVKNISRFNYTGVIVKQGDNVFRESVSFVDDAFYKMFDFPVKWGNQQHFTDADGIVLTQEFSKKLFGNLNPVGRTVTVRFNNEGHESPVSFTIKGVLEKQPIESSFYFTALVPYSKMLALGLDKTGDWKHSVDMTFVEADNEKASSSLGLQSRKYLQLYNAANVDDKITAFHFQPLNSMNIHAYKVNNNQFAATNIVGYIMLLVIALATLLLVYFNYMNIAIASAATRLKEIGVRKIMGSSRKQIIFQFIMENIILCTIAIGVGLFLAKYIFLPWFSNLANVDLSTNLFNNYRTWVALIALIIVSALSGASYPSVYISAFKPVNIIKGNSKMGSKNRFRKALLGFQFFLTFLAISTTLAFIRETAQIKRRPWGYDPANNVVVTLDKSASFDAFKDELQRNSNIIAVSGTSEPLGNYSKQMVIKTDGQNQTVQSLGVLPGFATQLGIGISKGRDLNSSFGLDETASALVNRAFLRQMHWKTGIGKTIEYGSRKYQVVGEVNDFHFENFQTPITPVVLVGCTPAEVRFCYVKTKSSLFSNAHTEVEKSWKKVNPNLPFDYYYQDGVFDRYFDGFNQASRVMGAASVIMIVISISGIFSLALLILGKKMKEISVRKVLGAGFGTITFLINREFLFAIGFAIIFGLPVSWFLVRTIFNQITPESSVSVYPILLSFVSLIMMTIISVSWHIYKANTANPTEYLKDE